MMKQLGIIGMGIMGRSLARNWARQGYTLALYNRRVPGSEEQVALALTQQYEELSAASAFEELSALVEAIARPRKIVLMITAGPAVDALIQELTPFLEVGDLIIDAGNAYYRDSERRMTTLNAQGILMLGLGVSGGEKGALEGASLMAGGSASAYAMAQDLLKAIAAKGPTNQPTLKHIGPGGAGHFVKMVHNAIEYAEMQIIADAYAFMHHHMGFSYEAIAAVFEQWNETELQSYLLEISCRILRAKDPQGYVLDQIVDRAAFNQTASSTLIEGALAAEPLSMVASALFARFISSRKDRRDVDFMPSKKKTPPQLVSVDDLKNAYAFARILNHYQHFEMIAHFSDRSGWNIDLADLCAVWASGCIIRSELLQQLMPKVGAQLSLFFDQPTRQQLLSFKESTKRVVAAAMMNEVPLTTISAALTYYQQLTQARSSAALIQAQRDYFGAHGLYLIQQPEVLTSYPWHK